MDMYDKIQQIYVSVLFPGGSQLAENESSLAFLSGHTLKAA